MEASGIGPFKVLESSSTGSVDCIKEGTDSSGSSGSVLGAIHCVERLLWNVLGFEDCKFSSIVLNSLEDLRLF